MSIKSIFWSWAIWGVLCPCLGKPVFGQSDDLKVLLKLAEKKSASLKEAKAIREKYDSGAAKNAIEYAYAVVLVQNRQFEAAEEILEPFVDKYPNQFLARQLLIRCLVERKRFELLSKHVELSLSQLPNTDHEKREFAFALGTVVGFMRGPGKDDCNINQVLSLESLVDEKMPGELKPIYQLGLESVGKRVAELEESIQSFLKERDEKLREAAQREQEKAERAKEELDDEKDELEDRDKSRELTLDRLNEMVLAIQRDYAQTQSRINGRLIELDSLDRQRTDLIGIEVIRDANGVIISQRRCVRDEYHYNRLTDKMNAISIDLARIEARLAELRSRYDQLRQGAAKIMNEKQLDQYFTAHRLIEGKRDAYKHEARASRIAQEANRIPPAVRSIRSRIEIYETYHDLPVPLYQDFLSDVGKRIATR